jgi:uroporphyrin-III C-methyltransferase
MSEEQKPLLPAEVPTATTTSSSPRSLAQPLAIAALVIALGTLVGGYFVWHEVQRQAAWQQQVLGQIDSRGQALDQRLEAFKDRLDNDLAATERSRRNVEEQQRQLATAHTGLEDALAVLRAQLGRSQHDWVLAEVQYLLTVANQRVQLQQDTVTAAAALESADQRLQGLADPGFNPVREQIASELTALRVVSLPDLAGIALTLDTLAKAVGELPLKDAQARAFAPEAAADDATDTTPESDWTRLPRLIWDELRRMVVIRRNDTPIGPLLPPEQQFFLYENLRLQLSIAHLAAVSGDTTSYRASLKTAADWLGQHFAADAPRNRAAHAELERLAAIDLRPALPDISASLRLLRQQMRLDDLKGGAPATGSSGSAAPAEAETTP